MNNDDKKGEVVLCIYDTKGVSIKDRILEVFEKYVLSNVKNMGS